MMGTLAVASLVSRALMNLTAARDLDAVSAFREALRPWERVILLALLGLSDSSQSSGDYEVRPRDVLELLGYSPGAFGSARPSRKAAGKMIKAKQFRPKLYTRLRTSMQTLMSASVPIIPKAGIKGKKRDRHEVVYVKLLSGPRTTQNTIGHGRLVFRWAYQVADAIHKRELMRISTDLLAVLREYSGSGHRPIIFEVLYFLGMQAKQMSTIRLENLCRHVGADPSSEEDRETITRAMRIAVLRNILKELPTIESDGPMFLRLHPTDMRGKRLPTASAPAGFVVPPRHESRTPAGRKSYPRGSKVVPPRRSWPFVSGAFCHTYADQYLASLYQLSDMATPAFGRFASQSFFP